MPKRILLIEDESDIVEVYTQLLTEAGFEVTSILDGARGFDAVEHLYWDLLLLDIMLPGRDGIEILEKVKSIDALKNKPVLLLTQLGGEHIIKRCFDLGATDYLIKAETTPGKVVEEVKNLLKR